MKQNWLFINVMVGKQEVEGRLLTEKIYFSQKMKKTNHLKIVNSWKNDI